MNGIPVCLFAKPPVPGKVKSRLAKTIGDHSAASLAAAMLSDVWRTVCSVSGITPILAAAEKGRFPVSVAAKNLWLQKNGDLGFRIEDILRRSLRYAPSAIALGADSPLIVARHLENALHQLEFSDAVIGPSCDGGFYLLGLRSCSCGLLQDLPWSAATTEQSTEERLHLHGMSISRLEMLTDVDMPADLQSLYNKLKDAPPETAPATKQWFVEHRSHLREFQW